MRVSASADFIWSLSTLEEGAVLLRLAAREADAVRKWLRGMLGSLRDLVGEDAFNMALG